MRRDLGELQDRLCAIKRQSDAMWRYLIKTDAPHAEEHYDLAHAAAQTAEDALGEVLSVLGVWAAENNVTVDPHAHFTDGHFR